MIDFAKIYNEKEVYISRREFSSYEEAERQILILLEQRMEKFKKW